MMKNKEQKILQDWIDTLQGVAVKGIDIKTRLEARLLRNAWIAENKKIENKDNLLLIGMNTDVEIEILNEEVALALPAGSLRTRKDIASVAPLLGIDNDDLNNFLTERVSGENFDTFIVLKKTNKGAKPIWVKVGKTDLNYVEVKQGIEKTEVVYVLPSEGLIKYQQKFSERVKGRFG